MPDPTPGSPAAAPGREPETGALFQVLVTGERDPAAIYTAIREVEAMAGRSVVAQLGSEIRALSDRMEGLSDRMEARFDTADARFDAIDRQLRLIGSFLFTMLAMLAALLLRG